MYFGVLWFSVEAAPSKNIDVYVDRCMQYISAMALVWMDVNVVDIRRMDDDVYRCTMIRSNTPFQSLKSPTVSNQTNCLPPIADNNQWLGIHKQGLFSIHTSDTYIQTMRTTSVHAPHTWGPLKIIRNEHNLPSTPTPCITRSDSIPQTALYIHWQALLSQTTTTTDLCLLMSTLSLHFKPLSSCHCSTLPHSHSCKHYQRKQKYPFNI